MTLWFDVVNSPSLSEEQKGLVMRRLATRIGKDGVSRVISQQTGSHGANRELAVERFGEQMREAVRTTPIRKKTRVSKAAKERQLEEKRQRSVQKRERSKSILF